MDWIVDNEPAVRGIVFAGVLLTMLGLETVFPRRDRISARARRWSTNGVFVVLGTLSLRLLIPIAAVGTSLWAARNGIGVFNSITLPVWIEITAAIILLDLAIYGQHVATHKIPLLWRLHQVHHADRDFDTTTALRFHPIEILLSMLYKMGVVLVLGPASIAVIIFEVLLNACAMFNHANLRMPASIDRILRAMIVTPDMHRVHHSVRRRETDSNYGFCLSLWDRLFHTYTPQPVDGHEQMAVGLPDHQTDGPGKILYSLLMPFKPLLPSQDHDTGKARKSECPEGTGEMG